MKRFIVIIMLVVLLITPLMLSAIEKNEINSAIMDANKDAKDDIDGSLWLGAGCLFNLLGVGAACLIEPIPRASRLVGKSSEYVSVYADEYKRVGKGIQIKRAEIGCAISSLLIICIVVLR